MFYVYDLWRGRCLEGNVCFLVVCNPMSYLSALCKHRLNCVEACSQELSCKVAVLSISLRYTLMQHVTFI